MWIHLYSYKYSRTLGLKLLGKFDPFGSWIIRETWNGSSSRELEYSHYGAKTHMCPFPGPCQVHCFLVCWAQTPFPACKPVSTVGPNPLGSALPMSDLSSFLTRSMLWPTLSWRPNSILCIQMTELSPLCCSILQTLDSTDALIYLSLWIFAWFSCAVR